MKTLANTFGYNPKLFKDFCGENPLKEKSHFRPSKLPEVCRHPSHNPPTMMVIPHGEEYVHVCPCCGYRVILRGNQAFC